MGWRELVFLPELALGPVHAKADTGALSAALHAEDISVYTKNNIKRVHFAAYIDEDKKETKACDIPLYGVKRVKNSSGKTENRWVIRTTVLLGESSWSIVITLADRADMETPMLLGRACLQNRFLVNPGVSYLLTAPFSLSS